MRRYIKYIFLCLILGISASSCIKELDAPQIMPEGEDLTLVPRVKSFTNQYVTKSGYSEKEAMITHLAVLVFNTDGDLVYLEEKDGTSLTLNKSMLNSPAQTGKLAKATVVMFANMNLSDIKDASGKSLSDNKASLTLAGMESYTCHFAEDKVVITDLSADGFTGFPMVGGKSNVDLTSTRAQQGAIPVDLKVLYAKVNFTIRVENGTENTGTGMNFVFSGYSVFNASKATSLAIPTDKGEHQQDFLGRVVDPNNIAETDGATASSSYKTAATAGTASGTVDLDGTMTFTFYVSESRYNHGCTLSDLRAIYPDGWVTEIQNEDVKGYTDLSAADQAKRENHLNNVKYFYDDLAQQYKPKLTESANGKPAKGLATYVQINGTYTDYRGTAWTVNYKVYLGKDNAQNFHVDRNSEYTNYITIKGIRNNSAHGDKEEVWLDHRVDASTNDPSGHVTITRETLLDAHIEVRPLRVKWDGNTYAGVKVYLPTKSDGSLENWIGIERFTGSNCQDGSTYCYQNGKSIGKRKYFTDDLISELQTKGGEFGVHEQDGKKFIYLQNGDCAWIYFDENTFTGNTRNTAREATITLEFVDDSGNTKAEETYNIKQAALDAVSGLDDSVESYEEYLHSYDSVDKYSLSTNPADYTQQGLAWGLTNGTISKDIIVSASPLDGSSYNINIGLQSYVDQRYDYFQSKDVPSGESYYSYIKNADDDWVTTSYGIGLDFTNRATYNNGITVKDMGTAPDNAYQYCLSKNKFKADDDGNVTMTLHWYLPDVYQIQYILNDAADNAAVDFNPEDYYWSSQPSYSTSATVNIPLVNRQIGVISEASETARAVSKNDGIKDLPRSSKHRIRCLYNKAGKVADMTDRTPDGVGGLSTFIMKGYTDLNNSDYGYFKNSVKDLEAKSDTITKVKWPNTNYPTRSNSYNVSGAEFKYVVTSDKDDAGNIIEGFEVNPTFTSSWTEYTIPVVGTKSGYYHTLRTYPGLTQYTLDSLVTTDISIYAYKPTTTKKSVVETITSSSSKELTKNLPSSNNLDYLDHLKGGKMFNISFAKSDGTSDPVYFYDETVSGTVTTNTYNWSVPIYKEVENKKEAEEYLLAESGYTYTTSAAAVSAAETRVNNGEFSGYSNVKITTLRASFFEDMRRRYKYIIKGTTYKKYYSLDTEGKWTVVDSDSDDSEKKINNDELRIYSGNSITISLSNQTDEEGVKYSEGYEITKVKVHYSRDNLFDNSGYVNRTYVYARFVDENIYSELPKSGDGSNHLQGWDYDDISKTQQWAGEGRESVTLNLADYVVSGYSIGNIYNNFTYQYAKASKARSKYLVIDKIEVKCTKKSTE